MYKMYLGILAESAERVHALILFDFWRTSGCAVQVFASFGKKSSLVQSFWQLSSSGCSVGFDNRGYGLTVMEKMVLPHLGIN
jgi:hypothetical protein